MTVWRGRLWSPPKPYRYLAPRPRAPQWLDGLPLLDHGRLMEQAFGGASIPDFNTFPVMYLGEPHHDSLLVSEVDGIDFEGNIGVIFDEVPMAATPHEAAGRNRLIDQIND